MSTSVARNGDQPDDPVPAGSTDPRFDAPATAAGDDPARAVIVQAVAIMRELAELIRAYRDDCDAMAAALQDFAARHDARLRAHRLRALAIPADRRAALLYEYLDSIAADLDATVRVLDSCRGHAGVHAALERLQML